MEVAPFTRSPAAMAVSPNSTLSHPRRVLAVYYLLPPSLQKSVLAFALLLSTMTLVLVG
jgi:hypothetical protein